MVVRAPFGDVEVHAANVPPGSSHGWLKVETFEGIFKRLAVSSVRPRLLCGDFNTPQAERADGRVVTWAECVRDDDSIRFNRARGIRWDKAERDILVGLADHDLHDVFRGLHGYGVQDSSWFITRRGKTIGRRFDHVFASVA
jgi:exonuclease III